MRYVTPVYPVMLITALIGLTALPGCTTNRSTTFSRDRMVGVVYAENGAPVVGAEILLDRVRSGVSDSFGRFRIPYVQAGKHTITVTAEGYETAEKTLHLENRTKLVRVDMVSLAGLTDLAIAAVEQEQWDEAAALASRMALVDADDPRTALMRQIVAAPGEAEEHR